MLEIYKTRSRWRSLNNVNIKVKQTWFTHSRALELVFNIYKQFGILQIMKVVPNTSPSILIEVQKSIFLVITYLFTMFFISYI